MHAKWFTRKFVAASTTAILMAVCWVACQWLPLARDNFPALVTGLVGALSAFTAGNVVQDHVLTRNSTTKTVTEKVADFVLPKPAPEKPE